MTAKGVSFNKSLCCRHPQLTLSSFDCIIIGFKPDIFWVLNPFSIPTTVIYRYITLPFEYQIKTNDLSTSVPFHFIEIFWWQIMKNLLKKTKFTEFDENSHHDISFLSQICLIECNLF